MPKMELGTTFEELRTAMLKLLDAEAEACHARFTNISAIQQSVYDTKVDEANRLSDRLNNHDHDYDTPHLDTEAAVKGITREEVAKSVLDARTKWQQISATIEARRLQQKLRIKAAKTPAELRTIQPVQWDEING